MVEAYFMDFRILFKEFAHHFKTASSDEARKALILNLCNLNSLYAIQQKLKYDIPPDLKQLAYDFDSPDYPGLVYITQQILSNNYILLEKCNKQSKDIIHSI